MIIINCSRFVGFQYAAAAAALSTPTGNAGLSNHGPPLFLYPPPYPSLALSCLSSAAAAASLGGGGMLDRFSTKSTSIADLRLKARRHAEALGLWEKPM